MGWRERESYQVPMCSINQSHSPIVYRCAHESTGLLTKLCILRAWASQGAMSSVKTFLKRIHFKLLKICENENRESKQIVRIENGNAWRLEGLPINYVINKSLINNFFSIRKRKGIQFPISPLSLSPQTIKELFLSRALSLSINFIYIYIYIRFSPITKCSFYMHLQNSKRRRTK